MTTANLKPTLENQRSEGLRAEGHLSKQHELSEDDEAQPTQPDAVEPATRAEASSLDRSQRRTLYDRLDSFITRLSTRNNFWRKVCSLIWLPYAFRSGITLKRLDAKRFTAVLPFRRFNRNWYNAMAGAALLGNSEVAGGMYLFAQCGPDYVVVCKELHYKFLRPCYGPAVYHVVNAEDVHERIAAGGEFNIELQMEIRQQLHKKGREARVGRCRIVFHCTPKAHIRSKSERRKEEA